MKDNYSDKMNLQELSSGEKAHLKERIVHSVHWYIQRKRAWKYGMVAAAALVILMISIPFLSASYRQTSDIEGFAKTMTGEVSSGNVQLILKDDKQVGIADDTESITYSSSGQKVTIGESKSIDQSPTISKKPVFNTLIVPFGKRSKIVLSDGTKVWLNSGSKLIFPPAFSKGQREVYLEGEAIFEVAHQSERPFLVKTKYQEIEVLGTIFNVSNYGGDDAIYTVLKSGSVQINFMESGLFNTEKNIKITPGTMAVLDKENQAVKTKKVAVERYFSWRDGVFIFKNDSLKYIMEKISRYYNVEITINDKHLANRTFSGSLDVTDRLENVIQTIMETQSSPFEYRFTEDGKLIIN